MRLEMAGQTLGALLVVLAAGTARAETIEIRIENLSFAPPQVAAHIGDTIEWVNADFIAHTATARNGAWDIMIPPNATKSVVLKVDGTVEYYCTFHPNMTGQVMIAK
jgi:plastocyanin